jgi:hypothetical protein
MAGFQGIVYDQFEYITSEGNLTFIPAFLNFSHARDPILVIHLD